MEHLIITSQFFYNYTCDAFFNLVVLLCIFFTLLIMVIGY